MKRCNGNASSPSWSFYLHNSIKRSERDTHIAWVSSDTLRAGAEDSMDAVEALKRPATRTGRSLVAGHRGVGEVVAARALQQVAAVGCLVTQLRSSSGKDGL